MIIEFNPTIFSVECDELQLDLQKIILEFLNERFLWDFNNICEIFPLDKNGEPIIKSQINDNLAPNIRKQLKAILREIYQMSAYVSNVHRTYLSKISVGLQRNEVHPRLVSTILIQEPSIIILENHNDWNLITGITEKYQTKNGRKEIFKLIKRNIDNKWIRSRQAGGKSQIIPTLNREKTIFQQIYKYKIMALFDSDRTNSNYLQKDIKGIIETLKKSKINSPQNANYEDSDDIIWHMLHKRELENYISVNLIEMYIGGATRKEIGDLLLKSPIDLDFLKYEEYFGSNRGIDVKKDFPLIFNERFNREVLEKRCEHHKIKIPLPNGTLEDISEMEQILLKIAKII